MRRRSRSSRKPEPAGTLRTSRLQSPLQVATTIAHLSQPPRYPPRERIHPRRLAPLVPEGPDEVDEAPSPPTALDAPLRLADMALGRVAPHALTDNVVL